MRGSLNTGATAIALASLLAAGCALSRDGGGGDGADGAGDLRLERPLWGDLHVHTKHSFDAHSLGNKGLGPEEAYRFARGEPVISSTGQTAQLRTPLDFLLIADHAEFLGVLGGLDEGDRELLESELGARWSGYSASGAGGAIIGEYVAMIERDMEVEEPSAAFRQTVWDRQIALAEAFNEPGVFTTLMGYEWTSMAEGANLHRVVVFADGAERVGQLLPFSALDSVDVEDLWAHMARYESETGGAALAIPHNGNLSNGAMFADHDFAGAPLSRDYAERRALWEPLYEVTQVKGDSEAHPYLSPLDEFADFETWDATDIAMNPREDPSTLAGEYARSGLKSGLHHHAELGVNPFKFGLIGSTDSHTSLATADSDNFFGKFPETEPSPERMSSKMAGQLWRNWRISASGYAAVWAEANTREAIFAALTRKEAYASTGPRIALRFFGGWDYQPADAQEGALVEAGYAGGVPMGGDLPSPAAEGAPAFLIAAAKDPHGANLDRVQIIKGWRDEAGEIHEAVYDVALSDGRAVDASTGRATPVGSTVHAEEARYENSIGAPDFHVMWRDPDFDASEYAFYYVRVLEIPTPRWSTHDAARYGVTLPAGAARAIQERAYSSPIWYAPPDGP
ncbi:MAG: DUF3604 domain-containing protein [Caulobacterales bacterium]|nr:DUF3604 domain-containing protein [Caulobacterales bacterium]